MTSIEQEPRWYLKEWMRAKRVTQEEAAARMGTNKGQINKLVNGKQPMKDRWIVGFAKALGIEWQRLARPPGSPSLDHRLVGVSQEEFEAIEKIVSLMLQKPHS